VGLCFAFFGSSFFVPSRRCVGGGEPKRARAADFAALVALKTPAFFLPLFFTFDPSSATAESMFQR
jgi:hypothetical protein